MNKLPDYLIIALQELQKDITEVVGSEVNPRIIEYHQTCSLKATSDETPWCSAFVNWCVTKSGLEGTNSAVAISWAEWGKAIDDGELGCIVVMTRPGGNHVGFYLDEDASGVYLLGGNQGDKVCVRRFSWDNITDFRIPE